MNFIDFTEAEARRIWDGDQHRRRSIEKARRFGKFLDYGARHIWELKAGDIHRFFDELTEEGLSDNTVNHYAAMFSAVFKHAARLEVIDHVPQFTWKKLENTARPTYYTEDQLASIDRFLRNHRHSWMAPLCTLSAQTGMRLSECLSVTPETLSQDGQGNWWVYLPKTKNGDSRWVPVNSKARAALAELNDKPSTYWNQSAFYKTWARMRRIVLDGKQDYVFHTLRHTAATNMANDLKANTEVIGQMLGHRSLQTTRKYIKAKPEALQMLAAQLGEL